MKSVMAAIRYSRAKRTVEWEEPASVTITQVAQDLADREDLTRETKLVARSALLWYIKSGAVDPNEDIDPRERGRWIGIVSHVRRNS